LELPEKQMEGDLFRSVGEVENKRQAMVVNRNTENNRRVKKKHKKKLQNSSTNGGSQWSL
jgi:hypothetical protein